MFILAKRTRRQRRGLRARGQRGGPGGSSGKSNGKLQKVAAFHDVSLFVLLTVMRGELEWMRRDEWRLNRAFRYGRYRDASRNDKN